MSDDKNEEKQEDKSGDKKEEVKPPVMRMARTTSSDNKKDDASIYDTMQIKTLALNNNPVAQAVADMLGKTEDPDIRNSIKKAATDVMKPQLGSPEELNKKLEAKKEADEKTIDNEAAESEK